MKKLALILAFVIAFAGAASAQSALSDFVKIMNSECPEDLGDGMTMEKVFIEKDNVVFLFNVQEADVVEAMSQMPELMDQMADMMLGSMAMDDAMHMIFSMMVQEKKNLIFRFVSTGTDKIANLTVPSSKLAATL